MTELGQSIFNKAIKTTGNSFLDYFKILNGVLNSSLFAQMIKWSDLYPSSMRRIQKNGFTQQNKEI
jgi:hypothetical protein